MRYSRPERLFHVYQVVSRKCRLWLWLCCYCPHVLEPSKNGYLGLKWKDIRTAMKFSASISNGRLLSIIWHIAYRASIILILKYWSLKGILCLNMRKVSDPEQFFEVAAPLWNFVYTHYIRTTSANRTLPCIELFTNFVIDVVHINIFFVLLLLSIELISAEYLLFLITTLLLYRSTVIVCLSGSKFISSLVIQQHQEWCEEFHDVMPATSEHILCSHSFTFESIE